MTNIDRDELAKMLKNNPDLGLDASTLTGSLDLKSSDGEALFDAHWQRLGGPPLVKEYTFSPTRKWRFDGAFLDAKPILIAFEIEGGVWQGQGHANPYRFEEDCEKYNTAQMNGWFVFRFTPQMLERDPDGCLAPCLSFLYGQMRTT